MASFPLALSLSVFSTNALYRHESFTYFTPDVFSPPRKLLIIKCFRKIVRVSFSAPNASQQCGAFLFVGRLGFRTPMCPTLRGRGRARSGSVHRQWCLWALSCTLLSGNGLQPGFGRSSVHMTGSIMRSICTQEQRTWVGSNLPDPSWCISLFLFG